MNEALKQARKQAEPPTPAWALIVAGVLVYYIQRAFGASELTASLVVAAILVYELVIKREILDPLREIRDLLREQTRAHGK